MHQFRLISVSQGVIHFFAAFSVSEKPGLLQDSQVMRDGGGRHLDSSGDVGNTVFGVTQKPKNLYPGGVADQGEGFSGLIKDILAGHVLDKS